MGRASPEESRSSVFVTVVVTHCSTVPCSDSDNLPPSLSACLQAHENTASLSAWSLTVFLLSHFPSFTHRKSVLIFWFGLFGLTGVRPDRNTCHRAAFFLLLLICFSPSLGQCMAICKASFCHCSASFLTHSQNISLHLSEVLLQTSDIMEVFSLKPSWWKREREKEGKRRRGEADRTHTAGLKAVSDSLRWLPRRRDRGRGRPHQSNDSAKVHLTDGQGNTEQDCSAPVFPTATLYTEHGSTWTNTDIISDPQTNLYYHNERLKGFLHWAINTVLTSVL